MTDIAKSAPTIAEGAYYIYRDEDGHPVSLAKMGNAKGIDIARFPVPYGGKTWESIEAEAQRLLLAVAAFEPTREALQAIAQARTEDGWNLVALGYALTLVDAALATGQASAPDERGGE